MKRHRILRLSFYALTLGVCTLLCVMPACQLFKDDESSSDAEENVETPTDTEESAETPTDTEESVETPTDTAESVETPTDTVESVETSTDTEESVETPTNTAENGDEAVAPPRNSYTKRMECSLFNPRTISTSHASRKIPTPMRKRSPFISSHCTSEKKSGIPSRSIMYGQLENHQQTDGAPGSSL